MSVGAPRRPDRGRGEPDTAGPTGSILRAVLPGSRRLVAISLGSALRRRSRAAEGPGRPRTVLGVLADGSVRLDTLARSSSPRQSRRSSEKWHFERPRASCLRVWPLSSLPSGKSHSFPVWPLGLPQGLFTLQALCKHYVLALREPQPLTTPWGPPCGARARTISPGRRTEAVFPSARRWCPGREGTFTRLLRLPVTERK